MKTMSTVAEPYIEHTLGFVQAVEALLAEEDREDRALDQRSGIMVMPYGLVLPMKGAA